MKNLNDLIKDFEKKSQKAISSNKPLWEDTNEDSIYDVDIHIWRKPGMGNSLQTIVGNKVSIMTATTSYLHTLLDKKIINEKELDLMVTTMKGNIK